MTVRRELEALRTRVANQAVTLADAVRDGFEDFHIGAGGYTVELTVPEGPSTSGGKLARQTVRLVPRRPGYAMVAVGNVDPVSAVAELRTFEHVAILHELHFKRPLEITSEEYDTFLQRAQVVLNLARIQGTVLPTPADVLAKKRAAHRLSKPALIVFVVAVSIALLVVVRVAMSLRAR